MMNFTCNTRRSRSSSFLENAFLFFFIFIFFINPYLQLCKGATNLCNPANYKKASIFETNLNTVLNNLVQNTSLSSGFNTSVSGQSPDRIYGLLQCRGDASVEECYTCSKKANTSVRDDCRNSVGGRVWLDKCYLRYENYSFIGKLATNTRIRYNLANVSNPGVFSAAVRELFKNLSDEAPHLLPNRYSSASTIDSSFEKIFGLVQCWRDISFDDCTTCLSSAISSLLRFTLGANGIKQGGVAFVGSCIARYESYPFFTPAPPPPPRPPVEAPNSPRNQQTPPSTTPPLQPTPKKSSNKTAIILGILGGFLLLLLLGVFAMRRNLKSVVFGKSIVLGSREEGNTDIEEDSLMSQDHQLVFNLETLVAATRNFHLENKLGEGGFGPVYKGTMPDGKEIAVKKLSLKSAQGKREFLNEVNLVAKIQHRNLVNLLGCCAEGSERLLVYEYLPNKSLDKILFHPQRRKELDWQKRLNIVVGVARGLLYLHEDSQLRIIHRDIKASNILLDEKMNPKIADFGLARLFPEDETHISTKVAGTYGYLAPEYAMRGQLSAKADVYSFGVVLLEVVSGRKNTDFKLPPEMQNLIELAWRCYSVRNSVDVIDREIIESCGEEEGLRWIKVGLLCTQEDASLRPPMSAIYSMLTNPRLTNIPNPAKPAFISVTRKEGASPSTSSLTSVSRTTSSTSLSSSLSLLRPTVNDASVTELSAR